MTTKTFADLFRDARKRDAYWTEGAILAFTEEMVHAMERRGISRADLARELDTSPAYITKILRGDNNFTLATMVRIALALDMDLHLHLAPTDATTRWMVAYKGARSASRRTNEEATKRIAQRKRERVLQVVRERGQQDDIQASAVA